MVSFVSPPPQLLVVINILLSIYLLVFKHGGQSMLLKGMLLDIRLETWGKMGKLALFRYLFRKIGITIWHLMVLNGKNAK